jgi:hypothetical protein
MFAFNIALLLLAAPVVSQPEAAEPRQLWWHHVENAWNSVVENVGHVWDSFGLDRTFPKLTEALESFVNEGWNFITDLKNGVTSVVDKFRNLGESIVEGYNPNGDWIANVATIVANVNQAVDCSTDTFELVVGVKCDADIQALEAELLSVWNAKSTINNRIQSIDVVDVQDPCPASGVHLMEIEFDVRVRGDGIDSGAMNAFIEGDLKPELVKESNWDIATETSLAQFLPAMDDDYQFVVNLQPDFCEAWDAGATEFTNATASIAELKDQVNTLTDEFNKARDQVSWWWKAFWKWENIGDLEDARNTLRSAEHDQEHGASIAVAALNHCANGQAVGPHVGEAGERFCAAAAGRRLRFEAQRVLV